MAARLRPYDPADRDAVLQVAARAWAPVFASVNAALGPTLAQRLHGDDWRAHHAAEVRDILDAEGMVAWVAEAEGDVVGFASARVVDPARRIGEVHIVCVDPDAHRAGVATALVREAEAWLRAQGMAVIFIGTGGDPGHEPARQLYASLGYHAFPIVQFYKVVEPDA